MLNWIIETMLKEEGNISEKDLDLFKVVDTAREAMDYILDNIDKTDYNF
jgi:predicted Rossmann-fold nucleotide-binding protein